MKLNGRIQAVVVLMAVAAFPAAALAQSPTSGQSTSDAATVEVTPFISLGSPMSSRVGTAIAFRATETLSIESEIGYRRGEVNALSASASLLYDLPRVGRARPYLAAGGGLEQYGTALVVAGGAIATQPRTAFVVNAGGGLKVPVDQHWGVRTDARWFNGIGTAPEHWRVFNGVTVRAGAR